MSRIMFIQGWIFMGKSGVFFVLITLFSLFMSNLFLQNKKFYSRKKEGSEESWYQIIIYVQRNHGYFLAFYFSKASIFVQVSDLWLVSISSWLFTDPCAWTGPTATPSHGSVFYSYCNIYHTLMLFIKLSFFPSRP